MEPQPLGQLAYEAYVQHAGGKSLATGDDLPAWGELSPEIQAAWQYSADVVRDSARKITVPPGLMEAVTRFGTRDHTVNHLTDLGAFVLKLLEEGRIVVQ